MAAALTEEDPLREEEEKKSLVERWSLHPRRCRWRTRRFARGSCLSWCSSPPTFFVAPPFPFEELSSVAAPPATPAPPKDPPDVELCSLRSLLRTSAFLGLQQSGIEVPGSPQKEPESREA